MNAEATEATAFPSIDELARAINDANAELDADERRLALAVYELLAAGEPVSTVELATHIERDEEWVRDRLDDWSGVFRDDEGRVVGFWGLAVGEMPHRLDVNGRTLYTWCAFDPLFIAPLLRTTGRVTSTCPVSGTTITLTVDENGVRDVEPPQAVLSFLKPEDGLGDDIIERFCHYVHLFASEDTAETWVSEHPGTFTLSIADGYELGRRTLGRLSGSSTRA